MCLHPGRLTIEYLRGRKGVYVLPLRLYLMTSIVFFLLFKLVMATLHAVYGSAWWKAVLKGLAVGAANAEGRNLC